VSRAPALRLDVGLESRCYTPARSMNGATVLSLALLLLAWGCGGAVRETADGGGAGDASIGANGPGVSDGSEPEVQSHADGSDEADASDDPSSSPPGGDSSPVPCSDYLSPDGGIHAGCTGGDCTGGNVCCGCDTLATGISVTTRCAPPSCVTKGGGRQLCISDSECITGTCQSAGGLVSLCMTIPEAGGAAVVKDGGDEGIVDAADRDGPPLCSAPSSGPCAGQAAACVIGGCGSSCFCSQDVWECAANPCPPPASQSQTVTPAGVIRSGLHGRNLASPPGRPRSADRL